MNLEINRNGEVYVSVPIDKDTVFTKKLMGEHKITAKIVVDSSYVFQINDYVEYNGEIFTILKPPVYTEKNLKTFVWTLIFEGEIYKLLNKRLRSSDKRVVFKYTGTAEDHLLLLLSNINSINPGWTAGEVDSSKELLIEYSRDSCRTALTKITDKFGFEYSVDGNVIILKKSIGRTTNYRFEYGKGKGLFKLELNALDDQNIVTRMYGYGGKKNIDSDYRDGVGQLIFDENGDNYLEKNTDIYGIIEDDYVDEDIYPHRIGAVTEVSITFEGEDSKQEFYIEDSSLNFDINDNLIEGATAQIGFLSGNLSGYVFDITKYDHSNTRIYFNPFSEEDGYTLPNELNQPEIENEYTLYNIKLPQEYKDAAESELKTDTQASLEERCQPQVVANLFIDKKYVKNNEITLNVGDKVSVYIPHEGIDKLIRVSEISYPPVEVNEISATIADFVPYTVQEQTMITAVKAKKETVLVDRRAEERARQVTAAMKLLKNYLLDANNEFDQSLITVSYLRFLLAASGTSAGNFILNPIPTFLDNYGGDSNAFLAPVCDLIHRETSIEIQGQDVYTWTIEDIGEFSDLTPEDAYYLYAKCSKNVTTAEWVLTTDIIASNQDNFYYFPVGTLLPFDTATEVRTFISTFGRVYINGRMITLGKIQSVNELNYFDLEGNSFRIGDENSSLDWNVTEDGQLTLKGVIVQSPSGATSGIVVLTGSYDPGRVYYKDEGVTHEGSTWRYINDTPASGQTPSEGIYWTIVAEKGVQGDQGIQGPPGENGESLYTWIKFADDDQGTNMSDDPTGKDYIGLAYNKTTQTESEDPADYTWALSKGEQGVPGVDGDDGQTTYTWIKYADDSSGNSMSDDPTGKDYIGLAYNKTTQTESEDPADYTWALFKGTDGQNAQYVQVTGEQVFKFLAGQSVPESTSIVLSAQLNGGLTTYDWEYWNGSAWENLSGTQDAQTYTLAYDNAAWDSNKSLRVRCLSDSNYDEITIVKVYDGETGEQGETGATGDDAYTVILTNETHAVACDESGTPNSGEIGSSGRAKSDVVVYKGTTQLTAVADGATPSSGEFKYILGSVTGGTAARTDNDTFYLDTITDDSGEIPLTIYCESTSIQISKNFTFSKVNKGTTGDTGETGATGAAGPSIMYHGGWDDVTLYQNNANVRSVVKVSSVYYMYKGTDNQTAPTPPNATYWEVMNSFENVATGLLLATLAYIENLGVRNLSTGSSGERMEILSSTNKMTFFNSDNNKELEIGNGNTTGQLSFYEDTGGYIRSWLNRTNWLFRTGSGAPPYTYQFEVNVNGVFARILRLEPSQNEPVQSNVLYVDSNGSLCWKKNSGDVQIIATDTALTDHADAPPGSIYKYSDGYIYIKRYDGTTYTRIDH